MTHLPTGITWVRTDVPALLRMARRDAIARQRPISRRFPLEEVAQAYEMLNRGEIIGRAIVVTAD